MKAVLQWSDEKVRILLRSRNIKVNLHDNHGKTALMHASNDSRGKKIVEVLLNRRDIKVNLQDFTGKTALM